MRASGSNNHSRANDSPKSNANLNNKTDEEREGLLSGVQDPERELDSPEHHGLSWSQKPWSSSRLAALAVACILFLIGIVFARTFLLIRVSPTDRYASKNAQDVTSNGTHDFRKTVLIVSIDGLRYEQLYTTCSVQS
jgi:hypothetical protein